MSFSNYLEERALSFFFRGQNITPPTGLYVALYISDPTEFDTGTEVNGGGYTRQRVNFSTVTTSDSKSLVNNTAMIEFPIAIANWGNITHIGIRDAVTGGNLLTSCALPISKTIETGDKVVFNANSITVALD